MCTSVKRCTGARKRDKAGEACYLVCHDRKGATSPLDLELSAVTSKGASARGDGTLWQKAAAVAEGDFAACMKQNCSCESVGTTCTLEQSSGDDRYLAVHIQVDGIDNFRWQNAVTDYLKGFCVCGWWKTPTFWLRPLRKRGSATVCSAGKDQLSNIRCPYCGSHQARCIAGDFESLLLRCSGPS